MNNTLLRSRIGSGAEGSGTRSHPKSIELYTPIPQVDKQEGEYAA